MPELNYCFNGENSCNACCGLYNLKLTNQERQKWLEENTHEFLRTDISKAENIVDYRQRREAVIENKYYNKETYVCPFIGVVNEDKQLGGCLLHPQGSPHKQISLWPHAQNFSFYGESICLTYDCSSKENTMLSVLPDKPSFQTYAFFVSNYNLLFCFQKLTVEFGIEAVRLQKILEKYLQKYHIPITSFAFKVPVVDTANEYWQLMGSLLDAKAYQYDSISITKQGKLRGQALAKLCKII